MMKCWLGTGTMTLLNTSLVLPLVNGTYDAIAENKFGLACYGSGNYMIAGLDKINASSSSTLNSWW